jgi:hypothetical protein
MVANDGRLSIDYWHTTVAAALGRSEAPEVVAVDGAASRPSGVAVDADGSLRAGLDGADYATTHPQSYVRMPGQRLFEERITVGPVVVGPVDLIAATLSPVARDVRTMNGTAPGEVVISVPAGWVGRQRRAMEAAAKRAGLGRATVVNGAESIVREQISRGAAVPVGSAIVVCRLDATVGELVVLRRHADRFEVVANYDLGEVGETPGTTLADQAGLALAEGLDSAGVDGSEIAAVYCHVPAGAKRALAEKLAASSDLPVPPVAVADLAAAFGAARPVQPEPESATVAQRRGGLFRSVVATAVASSAAGLLAYQMFSSATAYQKPGGLGMWLHTETYAWALVPLFATLAAASVALAVSYTRRSAPAGPDPALGSALILVAALGVGSAGALSLIGAQHFGSEPAPLLRWTLASTVPLAVILLVLGLVVARTAPPGSPGQVARAPWRDRLMLPLPALALAALSTVVIVASIVGLPPVDSDWWWRMTRILHGLGGGVPAPRQPLAAGVGRLCPRRCRCVVRRYRDCRGAEFVSGRRDHPVVAAPTKADHGTRARPSQRPARRHGGARNAVGH